MKATGKALADVIPGLGAFVYDSTVGTVFITSGSGVVGYRVATSLLEAGHKDVRVGVWKGDRDNADSTFGQQCADALAAKGAEVIDFDWTNEEGTYSFVMCVCFTVFLSISLHLLTSLLSLLK